MDSIVCRQCGETVYFDDAHQPVRSLERQAGDYTPRSFLIIGGDWLLHRCTISGAEAVSASATIG